MVEGWTIGVIILIIINIVIAAYGYGRLNQKVSDMVRRIARLENLYNGSRERIADCDDCDDDEKDKE